MRDSDWSRRNLLRSDWLVPKGAIMTTEIHTGFWSLSLWTFHMLFLYSLQRREKPEGVGCAVDPLHEIYFSC